MATKSRRDPYLWFIHRDVSIYHVAKYGVFQGYWFSTVRGIQAEVEPCRPQFDVRRLPSECYETGAYEKLGMVGDLDQFDAWLRRETAMHRAIIQRAIDAGIDLAAESVRQFDILEREWHAERLARAARVVALPAGEGDDDIPF